MIYDFDRVIERRNTGSSKWEYFTGPDGPRKWDDTDSARGDDQVLAMWVADMDFECPKPVIDAVIERAQHGIFGYTRPSDGYRSSIVDWMRARHQWEIQADWIIGAPGVVPAINFAVQAFTQPGDKILVQRPVYYPFMKAVSNGGCELVCNTLVQDDDGRYQMDFDDLEAKTADPGVKMAILCSPHNPIGRIWSEDELRRYAEICTRNDVIVIADEIHGDLILPGHDFFTYGRLEPELLNNVLICTAASKTFNLAGMQMSGIVIPNPELREGFNNCLLRSGIFGGLNPLAMTATEAAYRHGAEWLDQALAYIAENAQVMNRLLAERVPAIKPIPLEGTYLAWLDCRDLGMTHEALDVAILERAKVYLDTGTMFGPEGTGFQRINIACPRSIVVDAVERIARALNGGG
jgi:cystathionine beta-lyase